MEIPPPRVTMQAGTHKTPQRGEAKPMASPFRLDDEVALITGSGRGIGPTIAHPMAEQDAPT